MQQKLAMIDMQEMADLVELAMLACRTERDKRFVQGIVQKLNASGQPAPEINGEVVEGEPEPVSPNGKVPA